MRTSSTYALAHAPPRRTRTRLLDVRTRLLDLHTPPRPTNASSTYLHTPPRPTHTSATYVPASFLDICAPPQNTHTSSTYVCTRVFDIYSPSWFAGRQNHRPPPPRPLPPAPFYFALLARPARLSLLSAGLGTEVSLTKKRFESKSHPNGRDLKSKSWPSLSQSAGT